ncbi:MAG: class I SAM-dependent methyltransferase [Halopseudomonas sp.]
MNWLKESDLPPLAELQGSINQWFESDLGQQLLKHEQRVLDDLMPKLYGYHLLQISALDRAELTTQSPAGHSFKLVSASYLGMPETSLVAEMETLPIASECVDAVVLHHALDFACSPHQVLREAVRVLRPGGRLIVVGFNSLSFWGVQRLLPKRREQVPWMGHFMTYRRLHDWLRLLEMKFDRVESGFYRPPLQSARWMQRMGCFERWGKRSKSINGAFWVVAAAKETYAATPVGRNWRRRFAFPLPARRTSQAEHHHQTSKPRSDAKDRSMG